MDVFDNQLVAEKPKLDLFAALKQIDNRNLKYYDSLSDAQKKLFVPVVIMQWLACSTDNMQQIMTNQLINKFVFSLHRHPKLLYLLMVAGSAGYSQRYAWKAPAKRKTKFPKAAKVVQLATGYSLKRSMDTMQYLTNDQIVDMAKSLGYQQDELTELNAELKTR